MTLTDALNSMVGVTDQTAAKRPSWNGYIKIVDYVEPDPDATPAVPESYKVVFVTRASTTPDATTTTTTSGTDGTAGTHDDVGTYVIGYSGGTWTMPGTGSGESANQLVVDAQLWASMIADDWIVGNPADFESARSGGSGRW